MSEASTKVMPRGVEIDDRQPDRVRLGRLCGGIFCRMAGSTGPTSLDRATQVPIPVECAKL